MCYGPPGNHVHALVLVGTALRISVGDGSHWRWASCGEGVGAVGAGALETAGVVNLAARATLPIREPARNGGQAEKQNCGVAAEPGCCVVVRLASCRTDC